MWKHRIAGILMLVYISSYSGHVIVQNRSQSNDLWQLTIVHSTLLKIAHMKISKHNKNIFGSEETVVNPGQWKVIYQQH